MGEGVEEGKGSRDRICSNTCRNATSLSSPATDSEEDLENGNASS
jgi:hypothetical protein